MLIALGAQAAEDLAARHGVVPFVGVGAGFQTLGTDVIKEIDKKGWDLHVKGLGSLYREQWVFDLGLGYNWSRLSGTVVDRVTIRTDSALGELGVRYRLTDAVQIGPVLHGRFGTDQSLSETISDQKFLMFGGLQGLVELPGNGQGPTFRAGAQLLTDLNAADRQNFQMLIELQIGFDLFGARHAKAVEEARLPASVAPAIAIVTPKRSVLMRLPEDRFLFDTGMSHLRADRREYLQAFADFVAANPQAWREAIITGHTDARGSLKLNDDLSEARAHTVFDGLVNRRVPRERLAFKGMGPRDPVNPANNELAWQQNRRVEIEFRGLSDPERFRDDINRIDQRFFPIEPR